MSTQFTNRQWRLPNNENKDKQSNYSMDFSGTGDKIQTTLTPPLADNSRSISLWFYTSNSSSHNMCGYGAASQVSGHNGFDILTYTGNYVGIHLFGTAIIAGGTYNLNAWNHYVITYDGTTLQGYLNGVAVDSNSTEVVNTLSTNNFIIGEGVYTGFNGFSGKLDGVAIFDYALTDGTGGTVNQIAALYGSSSTGIGNPMSLSPKPVAYYPLGDQDAFNGANYLVPNSSLKDYVFDFDVIAGVGDSISATNVLPSASDFTISLWVNPDSSQLTYATTILFGNLPNGENLQIVSRFTNGYFYVSNGSVAYISQLNAVQANVWTLITVTYDNTAGVLTAYINGGESVYTSSSGTTLPTQAFGNIMYIGRGSISTTHFQGKISNTQIFDTALSASEVETLYNYGSPIRTLANIPQSSNLQGWWKLNASDTYDSSTGNWTIEDHAGSNDGTSSGMTQANLVQSDLSFTSGYSPYALDFDGTNDYIDCGDSDDFSFGDGTNDSPFSYSTWVNMDDATSFVLFSKYPDDNAHTKREYRIFISNADKPYLILYDAETTSSINYRVATNAITSYQNQWINLTFTYDGRGGNLAGDGIKIYLNGSSIALDATISSSYVSMHNTSTPVRIGRTLTSYANGKMSNCSLWNTDLTSSQVTEIYNEGVPSNLNNHSAYSNLVSWWQLGSNTSWVDPYWIALDEKGTNNGQSQNVAAPNNMGEDAIVDGVGSYANGLSSGMGGDEVIGDAPYSTANALSVNMDVEDRVTDTPS